MPKLTGTFFAVESETDTYIMQNYALMDVFQFRKMLQLRRTCGDYQRLCHQSMSECFIKYASIFEGSWQEVFCICPYKFL